MLSLDVDFTEIQLFLKYSRFFAKCFFMTLYRLNINIELKKLIIISIKISYFF